MDVTQFPQFDGETTDVNSSSENETNDSLGPEKSKELVDAAVSEMLDDERREVWRRRRDQMMHYISVLERNLDYDLTARNIT